MNVEFLARGPKSSFQGLRQTRPGSNGLALTTRERDVLAWVRAGKTNRQIAAELQISPHTVAKHLSHIYAKLGVHTRTAAVRQLPDHRRE